jgi:hypothetical protein
MRKYIIVFTLGLVIGAAVCGTLIHRTSSIRIGSLGGQLEQAIRTNRQLGIELDDAKVMVGQLGAELERNESFIAGTRSELESSKTSVQKIRAILERLRDLERGLDSLDND